MIKLSIRRPVAVSMAYVGVAILGVAAWRNIPIELLPDTELPQLTVRTSWASASPEAMEAFVTAPLEATVQQVRGVEKITSTSSEDTQSGDASSEIVIEFERARTPKGAAVGLSSAFNCPLASLTIITEQF